MSRRTVNDEAKRARISALDPTQTRGLSSRGVGRHGTVAERSMAARIGANTTPGSGNQAVKADINFGLFKLEVKSTFNRSISLKLDWLLKVKEQAVRAGVKPGLAVQFVDEKGKLVKNGSWVLMQETDYLQCVEIIEGAEE